MKNKNSPTCKNKGKTKSERRIKIKAKNKKKKKNEHTKNTKVGKLRRAIGIPSPCSLCPPLIVAYYHHESRSYSQFTSQLCSHFERPIIQPLPTNLNNSLWANHTRDLQKNFRSWSKTRIAVVENWRKSVGDTTFLTKWDWACGYLSQDSTGISVAQTRGRGSYTVRCFLAIPYLLLPRSICDV